MLQKLRKALRNTPATHVSTSRVESKMDLGDWVNFQDEYGHKFRFRKTMVEDDLLGFQFLGGEWKLLGHFENAEEVICTIFSQITWTA